MTAILLGSIAVVLAALFAWSFMTLPREEWQFIGAMPSGAADGESTSRRGVNFTWYGFFCATAYTVGAASFVFLMGAAGTPPAAAALAAAPILLVCAPASKILVRIVEGKPEGFTVGGASFVGLIVAPLVLAASASLAPRAGWEVSFSASLAAASVAYVFGEGLGRLGCISFGCCYGKPVWETSGWIRRFSERFHFVFEGDTKKIAFAAGLQGVPVVPVQAMTASLYAVAALIGISLFLSGLYGWAVAATLGVSQLWRIYSETLRADYRGEQKFTAYQRMALVGAAAAVASPWLVPASGPAPSLTAAWAALWDAPVVLALQALWAAAFVYCGRSTQTVSNLRFEVLRDRV